MTSKKEAAHTMGILLGITKWEKLLPLSEDVLYEMYRNYIKNAMEYNHLEDRVRELSTKVLFLESRDARKSLPTARRD